MSIAMKTVAPAHSNFSDCSPSADSDSVDCSSTAPHFHERPKRGWFSWVPTDRSQLAQTESSMLSHLERPYMQRFVAGINTLSSFMPKTVLATEPVEFVKRGPRRHIILLHGFGGGLAMWLPNIRYLIDAAEHEVIPTQIHALDMPGFARSDRHPMVSFDDHVEAMDYMTGHLREWFKCMALDRDDGTVTVDLVGHSFGGYVTANFAERYPQLVTRAVLCDPWGVPSEDPEKEKNMPLKFRLLLKLFYVGNPFSLLRGVGPFGPSLLPSVRKDFADRWEPLVGDPNIFFDYVYHSNAVSPPTGEQVFPACGTGPVFAKRPLESFVPAIPSSVDLAVIYGNHTWMDKARGDAMVKAAAATRPSAQNSLSYVFNAGHQVNTDNVDGFNNVLARELGLRVFDPNQ